MKADRATAHRCTSVAAVLELPHNAMNVGAVVRSIDGFGVGKLYVVTDSKLSRDQIKHASVGCDQWVYIRYFENTNDCVEHLQKKGYESWATSPHIHGHENVSLVDADFTTVRRIAKGLSPAAIAACRRCIQIPMYGMVESLNVAVSAALVLHTVTTQRRKSRPPSDRKMARWRKVMRGDTDSAQLFMC
jgi:tRNA (guanosine-2'-O-)-methyltransferase